MAVESCSRTLVSRTKSLLVVAVDADGAAAAVVSFLRSVFFWAVGAFLAAAVFFLTAAVFFCALAFGVTGASDVSVFVSVAGSAMATSTDELASWRVLASSKSSAASVTPLRRGRGGSGMNSGPVIGGAG